ncbi:MAG: hypothetical protein GOVbin707_30 [Prokaryotic dsDNA virus sp.]|nr:MAG: hypothetical protein GOVbin707_30 [Prokaryotic dsDNA virus sp.]|tara:strand:- start:1980 stop:2603 length:624 start_codon:yes stop_codon:yes gene_type:complete
MWAKLNDAKDTIEEIITYPKAMLINDINYPKSIFQWDVDELKDLGIVLVKTNGVSLDSKYYIEKDEEFSVAEDGSVVRTIGVKVADKKLDNEDAKDEEGNQLLHEDGSKVINYGLKHNAIQKVKTDQAALLAETDWYIIRKADAGTAIPDNIQTWRNAIRSDATEIETAITNASSLDDFIALHKHTYKDDGSIDVVARVNRWSKLGS